MTTSLEPWTLTAYPSGDKALCGAVVRDASGQQIGFFTDYRNAERVMEALQEIDEALQEIDAARTKIDDLETKLEHAEDEINEVKAYLEKVPWTRT